MNSLDHNELVRLWTEMLRAETRYERGYYKGRFDEYARQNAIADDELSALREEAAEEAAA